MKQVWVGGSSVNMQAAEEYWCLWGSGRSLATSEFHGALVAADCTLSNFAVRLSTAPGAGTSRTFTVRKNGLDTSLAVTISNTDTTATNTSDTVSLSAGDWIELKTTISGSPANSDAQWAIDSDTTGNVAIGFGNSGGGNVSSTAVNYVGPGFGPPESSPSATESDVSVEASIAATITALYFEIDSAPSANGYTFQLRKNGADVPGTSVTLNRPTVSGSVTGLSVDVAVGDVLSISSTPNTPTDQRRVIYGIAYTPDTAGEWMFGGITREDPADNDHTSLSIANRTVDNWTTAVETFALTGPTTWSLSGLKVQLETAPGVGNSRTFTLEGASGTLNTTVTISGTDTEGSGGSGDSFAEGDLVRIKHTETGTPAATAWVKWTATVSSAAKLTVTRADMTEDEVRETAGDQTIVLTWANATWAADVGSNAAVTEDLICGLDSAQSETFGWNNVVRGGECYSAAVLADSPAGYWRLGDASGDAADQSGNGNDGTYEGTQETGVGLVKNSAQLSTKFNDVLTKVMVPDTASAIDGIFDSGGTAEALIRPWSDGGGDQGRILAKNDAGGGGWEFTVYNQANGYVRLQFRHDFSTTDGVWVTSVAVPLSTASHVAVVYDNSDVANRPTIYINGGEYTVENGGLLEIDAPVGTRVSDASSDLYIGNTASVQGALHFRGEIQEAALYTSELSKTRILEHLKAASNPFGLSHADVVRTSDTVVTITLPDFPLYDISVTETVTVTAVASTHSGSSDLTGTPTFDVTPTDYVSPYNPGSGDPGGGGPGGTDDPGGSEDNPPDGSTGGGGPGDGTGGGAGGDDDFGGFNGGLGSQSPQANRTLGDGDTYSFGLAGLGVGLDPGGRIRVIRIDAAEISESS